MKNIKLYFIWFCNLTDTVVTLYLYQTGLFKELNPFMAYLLQCPILFGVAKIGIMTLLLVRLRKEIDDKKVKIAINIGCWIYGLIALYYAILVIVYLIL